MSKKQTWLPTGKDIEEYTLLKEMLDAQRVEFDLLCKKKADGQLNPMKIKMVNRVLEPLNTLLSNEASHKFLDLLSEDDMPTNSDVVLIISQYRAAMSTFREKYFIHYSTDSYGDEMFRWSTRENPARRRN